MGANKAAKEASASAAEARADEEARQARIRAGTGAINTTFDTQFYGAPTAAPAAPVAPAASTNSGSWQFTTKDRRNSAGDIIKDRVRVWVPDKAPAAAPAAAPTAAPAPAGPNFFDGLEKSYVDFARPQLDEQKSKAREQLVYALARDGTLDSSIRTERDADLTKDYNRGLTTITDKGREYATNARTSVEDARAQLISNLTATGDNVGAASAALARAKAIGTPPAYEPIGQLFSDWTAGFSQRAAQERAAQLAAGQTPTGGAGLFGTNRNAVKVS